MAFNVILPYLNAMMVVKHSNPPTLLRKKTGCQLWLADQGDPVGRGREWQYGASPSGLEPRSLAWSTFGVRSQVICQKQASDQYNNYGERWWKMVKDGESMVNQWWIVVNNGILMVNTLVGASEPEWIMTFHSVGKNHHPKWRTHVFFRG